MEVAVCAWAQRQALPDNSVSSVNANANTDARLLIYGRQHDALGDKHGNVTSVAEYVPDRAGTDMCEFLRCRYDDSLDFGSQPAVGIGGAPLGLEVYHVAHAPDYVSDTEFPADVYGEAVIICDRDTLQLAYGIMYDGEPLFCGEQSAFVLIDAYGHHDFVKHRECALEYIQMPCGERVKGPGEKSCRFHLYICKQEQI